MDGELGLSIGNSCGYLVGVGVSRVVGVFRVLDIEIFEWVGQSLGKQIGGNTMSGDGAEFCSVRHAWHGKYHS